MMKIICVLFVIIPSFLISQEELKWGKVSDFEKNYSTCDFDPNADAVVLASVGNTYFQFIGNSPNVYHHRHTRYKVLKESGEKHADIRLFFHIDDKISKFKAQTISPNGDIYELKNSEIFEEEVDEETQAISFSLPKIEVGAIFEFEYTQQSESIFTLPTWYFVQDVSTLKSHLLIDLPPYYNYAHLHTNGQNIHQKTPYVKPDARLNTDVTRFEFICENLPGITKEDYITTVYDYYTSTAFQLRSIKYPNQPIKNIMTTWDETAEEMKSFSTFGDQYLKKRKTKDIAEALLPKLTPGSTIIDTIHQLYDIINRELKWNDEYSAVASDQLEKVFENKIGNSADLNLIFIGLLRQLGVDEAYPLLISTRSNGTAFEYYPIINQFNHTLAYVEVDGEGLIFDLSDKLRPYNCPRLNSLNYKGWLIKDTEQKWIPINANRGSDVIMVQVSFDPDSGEYVGNLVAKYSNRNTVAERSHYKDDKSGEHWKKRLGENYDHIEILEAETENLDDLSQDFKEEVKLKLAGGFIQMDSFIYFKPITYSNFNKNPFKQEVRHCPVDFGYPMNETLIFNYKIPEGYIVEDLPKNSLVNLENGMGEYRFMASFNESNRLIQVMSKMDINQVKYGPEYYKFLKEFFGHINEKMEEQIVLKKI